jgi:hypothetical protein
MQKNVIKTDRRKSADYRDIFRLFGNRSDGKVPISGNP